MPTLRPAWQRLTDWLRQLPPRRRQALTSAGLICFALISLLLYTHYWADPEYQARLQKAGLVDTPPQARASGGQAEADRAQARARTTPAAPAAPPAPAAPAPAAAPVAPPAAPAALQHLRAPATAAAARGFGWEYSPLYGDWRLHDGLDYAAPAGATVVAAGPGKVSAVSDDPREGQAVTIDHPGGLQTHYAGLTQVAVHTGDSVVAGQPLGRIGAPGLDEAQSGPHLHFSVQRNGEAIDPASLMG